MRSVHLRSHARSVARLGGALAVLALTAACSSGGSVSSGGASSTAATAAAASGSAGTPAGGATVVTTKSSGLGTILVDGTGRTLYLWLGDSPNTSACTSSCAKYWPPLTTTSAATAGGKVDAGQLGTTKRSGGSEQVTYAGHPLYYYVGDKAPGDTAGEGSDGFGAKWWAVAPDGSPVEKSGTASSSGYGY